MKSKLRKIWNKIRIYTGFPQVWLFFIILILSIVVLFLSMNVGDEYSQSLFSNIFAGLITGLVLSLLSGTRQIYFAIQERKLNWLQDLHKLILDYFEMHHKFLANDYNGMDRDDFVYDMGAHVSWIKEHVLQSSFDRRLPFNSVKYCKNHHGFDAISFSKKCEAIHDVLCNSTYPENKDVVKLFKHVDRELRIFNSKVVDDMRNLEIKIATAQRSII